MSPFITMRGRGGQSVAVDLLYPRADQISAVGLSGIGRALGHINRYGGHAGAYSDALHCVNVGTVLHHHFGRPDLFVAGLFHDAPEIATGDMTQPWKQALDAEFEHQHEQAALHGFARRSVPAGVFNPSALVARISDRWEAAFSRHFEFYMPRRGSEDRALLKRADNIMLATERARFFTALPEPYESAWLHGCGRELPVEDFSPCGRLLFWDCRCPAGTLWHAAAVGHGVVDR